MGHKYLVAAFCCTWTIQLGYLILLLAKSRGQSARLKSGH
jgi:hypothetical protein